LADWLITSLSPGGGEKMSEHTVRSGDVAGLLARFFQLKDKVQVRNGPPPKSSVKSAVRNKR
jgi:transposase